MTQYEPAAAAASSAIGGALACDSRGRVTSGSTKIGRAWSGCRWTNGWSETRPCGVG